MLNCHFPAQGDSIKYLNVLNKEVSSKENDHQATQLSQ